MIQFEIYCGLDTNGHDVDAKQIAYNLALKYFPDGHSIREETGRWARRDHYGPTSEVITEQTLVITWSFSPVSGHSLAKAREIVGRLAKTFKDQAFQESVMVVEIPIDAIYV
jgi:hypothetical protein